MTTFDQIQPVVQALFRQHQALLQDVGRVLINRDLNGRVRLIVQESARQYESGLATLCTLLQEQLGHHAYPPERAVLYEANLDAVCGDRSLIRFDGLPNVQMLDRLVSETDWGRIGPESAHAPRVVFFSIKGGVGRSTALAAAAWDLAQSGKKVMVVDLDLESPGLSSALLPEERRPSFGITDWLVEDLVDNGDAVIADMLATSTLSHDGEIVVIPAHGRNPGEYVAKLGRVWMSKMTPEGQRESWSRRLARLIDALEARLEPDVILLDSRAGIDEVASSCVTDLGARLVLLFALDGAQTWTGYRLLFEHWRNHGVAREVRERLQLVGAMLPDDERRTEYFAALRESSHDLFQSLLYDEIQAGDDGATAWTFDELETGAPHYPWAISWNRGFSTLRSLDQRFEMIDPNQVELVFGPFLAGLKNAIAGEAV